MMSGMLLSKIIAIDRPEALPRIAQIFVYGLHLQHMVVFHWLTFFRDNSRFL